MKLTKSFLLPVMILWFIARPVLGFTYQDNDTLLVVEDSEYKLAQVIFDLGNVTNYTSLASGTQITITNWSWDEVTSVLGPEYISDTPALECTVMAVSPFNASSPAVWVTDGITNQTPCDLYAPRFQAVWNRINTYGNSLFNPNGTTNCAVNTQNGNYNYNFNYVMQTSTFATANPAAVSQLGGNLKFPVFGELPCSLNFYRLDVGSDPLPLATKIGVFQIDTNGVLTFTAGGS